MESGYLVTIPYPNYAKHIYRMQGKMVRAFFYNALHTTPPHTSPAWDNGCAKDNLTLFPTPFARAPGWRSAR
jgi:hypothetical protein